MEPAPKERAVEPEEARGAVGKAAREPARDPVKADEAAKAKDKVEPAARAAGKIDNR